MKTHVLVMSYAFPGPWAIGRTVHEAVVKTCGMLRENDLVVTCECESNDYVNDDGVIMRHGELAPVYLGQLGYGSRWFVRNRTVQAVNNIAT